MDRFIVDGQGRRLGIENALALKESLAGNHLDLKWFRLLPKSSTTQLALFGIFSDFHLNLRKPSKSQSIYFDSECPLYVFTTELTIVDRMGVPLSRAVAVEATQPRPIYEHGHLVVRLRLHRRYRESQKA